MRTPIIAGNWKLNKTISEAVDLVSQLRLLVEKGPNGVEVIVAPTFTALSAVSKTLEDSSISVAAQNLYWEEKGAFTGEVFLAETFTGEAVLAGVLFAVSFSAVIFSGTDFLAAGALALILSIFTSVCAWR